MSTIKKRQHINEAIKQVIKGVKNKNKVKKIKLNMICFANYKKKYVTSLACMSRLLP
jgi:hypothetical protein